MYCITFQCVTQGWRHCRVQYRQRWIKEVPLTFILFVETCLKDYFLVYCDHFAFIVFHKPSDADGKIASVWSGVAGGHLTVICWSCAIAWWLSSSKATGPCTSQPITAPRHSAVGNYRSVCVTTSLSSPLNGSVPAPAAISSVFLYAISSGTEIQ